MRAAPAHSVGRRNLALEGGVRRRFLGERPTISAPRLLASLLTSLGDAFFVRRDHHRLISLRLRRKLWNELLSSTPNDRLHFVMIESTEYVLLERSVLVIEYRIRS